MSTEVGATLHAFDENAYATDLAPQYSKQHPIVVHVRARGVLPYSGSLPNVASVQEAVLLSTEVGATLHAFDENAYATDLAPRPWYY